ncbi:hypothetical protein [Pseudomonas sp. R5(2019)]|uniref:hypothetical protein n=1 Tax=Pseudomonas sp. R5(2019) TaxID=2697566 RepID=UPI0014126BD9|nr:hypothetical protein [Pseudomonas sp. R5(2019)]NBA98400.1 hypothetical protein [Pseudomonas sp. R5(2019)]
MLPEIVSFPEGQRIWMVRASGGKHLNNFIHNNLVAISHVDEFLLDWPLSELPSLAQITEFVNGSHDAKIKNSVVGELDEELLTDDEFGFDDSRVDEYEKNISAINRINQTDTFINKIGIGDLIVTLDKDCLVIGCCESEAYIGRDVLLYSNYNQVTGKAKVETLGYKLRRDVTWGDPISRSLVGSSLRKPLLARNTVSNLDEYWDKVYSLVFSVFTRREVMYFSNRINRSEAISTRAISRLFEYVADTQLFADSIFSGDFDLAFFNKIASGDFFEFALEDRSTSQAEFMSPGNIYYQITKPGSVDVKQYAAIFILLLSLGISGCKENSLEHTSAAEGIKSFFIQRNMAEEREDSVAADADTDLMLRQFKDFSNNKKIANVADNLKLDIGINKSGGRKPFSSGKVATPRVKSKSVAVGDSKLISDQYELGL